MGRKRAPAARATARRTARRTTRRQMRRVRRRRRTVLAGGMIVLAGAASAIKLSQQDVQRIEQHTGASAEELTEEELSQAMQDLNIQEQPMTAADNATLADAGPTETEAAASEPNYLDELERLAQLRTQGIITDAEFEAKKKQLLGL